MPKKVFVSGCYDLLHSGHVEFFRQASQFGDLYVGIGSDATYLEYKHRQPMFPQEERLFMVKSIRYVKEAYINQGLVSLKRKWQLKYGFGVHVIASQKLAFLQYEFYDTKKQFIDMKEEIETK